MLSPFTVEILRQKTLFIDQIDLWRIYEMEWHKFKKSNDHLKAMCPIPPNCRVLPLHIYLLKSKVDVKNLRSYVPSKSATFAMDTVRSSNPNVSVNKHSLELSEF